MRTGKATRNKKDRNSRNCYYVGTKPKCDLRLHTRLVDAGKVNSARREIRKARNAGTHARGQMQIREKLRNKRMYRFSEAEYRVAIREEREAKL